MVQRRGNGDNVIMDMLRQIIARLKAVERAQGRGVHLEDVSDDEEVAPNMNPKPKVERDEERILRVLSRKNSKPVVEVSCYDGRLETNVVLDWISKINKFFEYENTPANQKPKIPVTKLKGHALLWWDHLQTERQKRGKEKTETWAKMIGKMKNKEVPSYRLLG